MAGGLCAETCRRFRLLQARPGHLGGLAHSLRASPLHKFLVLLVDQVLLNLHGLPHVRIRDQFLPMFLQEACTSHLLLLIGRQREKIFHPGKTVWRGWLLCVRAVEETVLS